MSEIREGKARKRKLRLYPKLEEAAILNWRGGDLSFRRGRWDSDRRGES